MKRFLFGMVAVALLTMMAGVMSSYKGCKGETTQKEAPQSYHNYDGGVRDWCPAFPCK